MFDNAKSSFRHINSSKGLSVSCYFLSFLGAGHLLLGICSCVVCDATNLVRPSLTFVPIEFKIVVFWHTTGLHDFIMLSIIFGLDQQIINNYFLLTHIFKDLGHDPSFCDPSAAEAFLKGNWLNICGCF